MTVCLIAALDADGAIGRTAGGLPWHLPDEAARFRLLCAGQWLLVGRRTAAEMTGWFQPDHRVIVLSRQAGLSAFESGSAGRPGFLAVAETVDQAICLAQSEGALQLVVIGGAQVYEAILPRASQLILSRVALHTGAEVRFPEVAWLEWRLVRTEPVLRDATSGVEFHFEWWERIISCQTS